VVSGTPEGSSAFCVKARKGTSNEDHSRFDRGSFHPGGPAGFGANAPSSGPECPAEPATYRRPLSGRPAGLARQQIRSGNARSRCGSDGRSGGSGSERDPAKAGNPVRSSSQVGISAEGRLNSQARQGLRPGGPAGAERTRSGDKANSLAIIAAMRRMPRAVGSEASSSSRSRHT
jgi:hypothetical protein